MAKQQAKSGDNVTRWIVIAMVSLVVVTGVVFSIFSQNSKESASLAEHMNACRVIRQVNRR